MRTQKITNIKLIGKQPTIDLHVNHKDHNFYAEGIVCSNSHSISYASLSALTTYLKFQYPQEFYLSLLKMSKHEQDPRGEISKIQKELSHFGIKLLRPDILKSEMDFKIEDGDIRFGLSSIKGISDKAIEKLVLFRKNFKNKLDIFSAADEQNIPITVLCALIQAGTLDSIVSNRTFSVYEAQLWNKLKDKEKALVIKYGAKFDYKIVKTIDYLTKTLDEKGKPYIKESRAGTIKKDTMPAREIYEMNKSNESFANWYYEQKLLGFSTKIRIADVFNEPFLQAEGEVRYMYLNEVKNIKENQHLTTVGIVTEARQGVSNNAKKTRYLKLKVKDEIAEATVLIFNDAIDECKSVNENCLPKEESIVTISGRRKGNDPDDLTIFADLVSMQDRKIYIKHGDIKEKVQQIAPNSI